MSPVRYDDGTIATRHNAATGERGCHNSSLCFFWTDHPPVLNRQRPTSRLKGAAVVGIGRNLKRKFNETKTDPRLDGFNFTRGQLQLLTGYYSQHNN